LVDGEHIDKIAQQLLHRGHFGDDSDARNETLKMITFIIDHYEKIDRLLSEIDRTNAGYTRALVGRTQYLRNTSRDTKGQLIEIIKSLPKLKEDLPLNTMDDLQLSVNVYKQCWVDENSLYREPKKRELSKSYH
jgi:hypothetical protein